jgi:hypothetical protein
VSSQRPPGPPCRRRTRFLGLWPKRCEGAGKGGLRPGQRV